MPTREYWEKTSEQWVNAARSSNPDITSADSLYSYMRESGAYVPRAYVRSIWNDLKFKDDVLSRLSEREPDDVLPDYWHRDTVLNYQQDYVYTVKIEGRLMDSGEPVERYVTIESNDPLSQSDILGDAQAYAMDYELDMVLEPAQSSLVDLAKRRS